MQQFSGRERAGTIAVLAVLLAVGGGSWVIRRSGVGSVAGGLRPVDAAGSPAALEVAAGGPAAGNGASAAGGTGASGGGPASPATGGATTAGGAPSQPTAAATLEVHVAGAVKSPGVYKFHSGDRIVDAIHAAGGFKSGADQDALNLADTLRDADQVFVPLKHAETAAVAAPMQNRPLVVHGTSPAAVRVASAAETVAPGGAAGGPVAVASVESSPGRVIGKPAADAGVPAAADGSDPAAPADGAAGEGGSAAKSSRGRSGSSAKFKNPGDGVVHLNSAGMSELEKLPGVGPAMAARILEYRASIGRFSDVSQIQDVKGIGQKKFAKMAGFLAL